MLGNTIQGARRPSMSITWLRDEDTGEPEDLTGATITCKIRREGTSSNAASDGSFVVTDGAAGVFRWDFSANDVATAGLHRVQFSAAFGDHPTPAKTYVTQWRVEPSLT